MNFAMSPVEATPRYRNFSKNIPPSIHPTPRVAQSLITVEKEREKDPEEECFMCRQSNIYLKPIGVSQERQVARRNPPPLTRAQIDALSQKQNLTKQEARKLLQCFFPEIKDVKYFQLHKYHSCCYDPKHLKLCKNHITAFQHERDRHPHHHHGDHNDQTLKTDPDENGEQRDRVSFVRIKIEPTKGIPTRFLGPAVLPESLAEMLLRQVNRFESKNVTDSQDSTHPLQTFGVRRFQNPHDDDDDDYDDEDDDDDDNDASKSKHRVVATSTKDDLVVEDLDGIKNGYGYANNSNDPESRNKKKKKKKNRKPVQPKLKHWEVLALGNVQQESCNCRHQVRRLVGDKMVFEWCRCKDNQHKDVLDKYQVADPSPEPPKEPPLPPKPRKPKLKKKSIAIDATEPEMTQLALAYDPDSVDYDTIQETIYYRTASGRLIKPEISNAFTYESIPPSMTLRQKDDAPTKSEVLYLSSDGKMRPLQPGSLSTGRVPAATQTRSLILSNPGSVYDGQVVINSDSSRTNRSGQSSVPILKLPSSVASTRRDISDNERKPQPAQFTIATFSPDKSGESRLSGQAAVQSPTTAQEEKSRMAPGGLQKSTKPVFMNMEPTPDFGRQSTIMENRRWFDQPLGDQNLRPVHDGQYGLIAGTSTTQYNTKYQRSQVEPTESEPQVKKNSNR